MNKSWSKFSTEEMLNQECKIVLMFQFILKEGTFCCRSQVTLKGKNSTYKEESQHAGGQEPTTRDKAWGSCQGKGPHKPLSKCFLCNSCCPAYLLPNARPVCFLIPLCRMTGKPEVFHRFLERGASFQTTVRLA